MTNYGQKIVMRGRCRPDGVAPLAGAQAAKMPLLTELGHGINDIRIFYKSDVRFLKQF